MSADEQTVLCRWAEQRYSLRAVVHVDIDLAEGEFGGSDVTPPDPWRLEVVISLASGATVEKHERDAAEIIRSIVATATG